MKINFWNGRGHSNEEYIHQISADGLFFHDAEANRSQKVIFFLSLN